MELHLLIILILLPLALTATEQEILLEFKQAIVDPAGILESWDAAATNPNVCSWKGVVCNGDGDAVVGINLDSFNLNGTMSPIICELPRLTSFVAPFNKFNQSFPSWFERCSNLVHLNLSQNLLSGPIPGNVSLLGRLPLRSLDLSSNYFTGAMPDTLGQLPATLQKLSLRANDLTTFTPSLSQLSNLTLLDISWNTVPMPASIPPEFGNLTKLVHLQMSGCGLTGSIPPELGMLKELDALELSGNNLTGSIPVELMYLPKLTQLQLEFDASQNALGGVIPPEIGQLRNLRLLQLYNNQLTGGIPESLAQLPQLEIFTAFSNDLTGEIPQALGSNSRLSYVSLSRNSLTGGVPPHLCAGNALQNLSLYENMLSGRIPETFGDCRSFMRLRLQDNHLEGPVPRKLWAAPNMSLLDVSSNRLNGTVTSDVRGALQLGILSLDGNRFEGALPDELGDLPNLVRLSAANNLISGFSFGNCSSLEDLDLSHNLLSGAIAADISNCVELTTVDLSGNHLSGQIPSSLRNLLRLSALDLADNSLSGEVPGALANLPLTTLNISNNNLEGAIPGSWRREFAAESFAGNPNLCRDTPCMEAASRGSRSSFPVTWILLIVGAVVLAIVAALCTCRLNSKPAAALPPQWRSKPFQRLPFDEFAVVDKLEESNVIGSGCSGRVYRVDLPTGHSLAVKQIPRSGIPDDFQFQGEVEALGQIRHRNVVKLLSCCWNADTDLLIFEYMPNGSLRDALHGKKAVALDWSTRYRIALGAAQGLSYLHHDCDPPILHRDVKSANILLDTDYEPKLADFGLAKLFKSSDDQTITMTNFAGSYGYIAPEYTYTLKVNTKSDTYSYGVVLLELVTGRRPVDSEYGDADIVRWAKGRFYAKGPQAVLDPRLSASSVQQPMIMLLDVALLCTRESPEERPTMRHVVEKLREIQPDKCYFPSKEEIFSPVSATSESTTSSCCSSSP